MFNGQAAQPQGTWQQVNQTLGRTGPPPAKKPRSAPIITKYPPPPGYRGPAQPHPPFQQPSYPYQQAWQPPAQHHGFAGVPYPGYAPQTYGVPQTYTQPMTPSWPVQAQYPAAQYPATSYPQHNYHHFQAQGLTSSTPQVPTWQPPASQPPFKTERQDFASSIPQKRRHQSVASIDQTVIQKESDFIPLSSENGAFEQKYEDLDDDDFYGECYFATHPEDIEPSLSLGTIHWKAPLPTKRALPSTWAEAELEALAPRKPLPSDDESISGYFIRAKRDEALLSIRQTEYWTEAKDDFVFKDLAVVSEKHIPLAELIKRYKDRPDPNWSARAISQTPEAEYEQNIHTSEGAMEVDDYAVESRKGSVNGADESGDVLGNLEQALQQNDGTRSHQHSRASSVASTSSQRISRPTPLMPVRDRAQESVLASLGVTGSPKLVYQTPGPATTAPPHSRNNSRHNSMTSNTGGSHGMIPPPPPPPPPGYPPDYYNTSRYDHQGARWDDRRRGSNASHRTASGSDFEDKDATPRPKTNRTDSRKRSHDSESDTPDERRRQDDDETPRQKRKHIKSEDPWSARRW